MENQHTDGAEFLNPTPEQIEAQRLSWERAHAKKTATPQVQQAPPTEAAILYKKKLDAQIRGEGNPFLKAVATLSRNAPRRTSNAPILPIEECFALVRMTAGAILSARGSSFSVAPNQVEVWRQLTAYFFGHPSKLNANKGIALCGETGRGKTFILEVFRKATAAAGVPSKFLEADALGISSADKCPEYSDQANLFIDDIGTDTTRKAWGNANNWVADVLTRRYNALEKHGVKTHISTNLPPLAAAPDVWQAKYGDRLASRFAAMFNFIIISGVDFRVEPPK